MLNEVAEGSRLPVNLTLRQAALSRNAGTSAFAQLLRTALLMEMLTTFVRQRLVLKFTFK